MRYMWNERFFKVLLFKYDIFFNCSPLLLEHKCILLTVFSMTFFQNIRNYPIDFFDDVVFNSWRVLGILMQTFPLIRYTHRKKYGEVKSGDRDGQLLKEFFHFICNAFL